MFGVLPTSSLHTLLVFEVYMQILTIYVYIVLGAQTDDKVPYSTCMSSTQQTESESRQLTCTSNDDSESTTGR